LLRRANFLAHSKILELALAAGRKAVDAERICRFKFVFALGEEGLALEALVINVNADSLLVPVHE
jgi:hypothetical protein